MADRRGQASYWQKWLHSYFASNIRTRGQDYARRGKVKLLTNSDRKIEARVSGSSLFTVYIEDKGREMGVYCSCPYFRSGVACKHLWAAAVAADWASQMKSFQPRGSEKTTSVDEHWRSIFTAWAPNAQPAAPENGGQVYRLRYRLQLRDTPRISVFEQYVTKSGQWGRSTRTLPESIINNGALSAQDRTIISLLLTHRQPEADHRVPLGRKIVLNDIPIAREALGLVLPLLAESGKCLLNSQHSETVLAKGEPYRLPIALSGRKADKRKKKFDLLIASYIELNGDRIHLSELQALLPGDPPHVIHQGLLHELFGPSSRELEALAIREGSFKVPYADIRDFVIQSENGRSWRLDLPQEVAPQDHKGILPKPVAEIVFQPGTEEHLSGCIFMDYNGLEIQPEDPRPAILDGEQWKRIHRNPEEERKHLQEAKKANLLTSESALQIPPSKACSALTALSDAGWTLRGRDKSTLKPVRFGKTSISSGSDWLELDGEVSFGEEIIPLPRVVRSYLQQGSRTIVLSDGSLGLLPEEWLQKWQSFLQLGVDRAGRGKDNALRFHTSQACLLDELLEGQARVNWDERFARIREGLRSFQGIQSLDRPEGFRGSLRDYQRQSLGWLEFLRQFGFGGVLADDMGLGKTIQVLAWLQREKECGRTGPSLIIAPTSLVFNWIEEARRFAPELGLTPHIGQRRTEDPEKLGRAEVILTSYGVARRDIELLRQIAFQLLVLDESQAIKNPDSETAKTVRILQASQRLCLTGTPLENHAGELWSQMEFLNPGLLGSRSSFNKRFLQPINQGDQRATNLLSRMVRPFILRRAKEEVASELPEKMEETIICPMTQGQAALYSQIRDHYRSTVLQQVENKGLNKSHIKILEALTRLRQAACHPGLLSESREEGGKLEELLHRVDGVVAGGHKALIFSQFTKFLGLIKEALRERGHSFEYLDGRTPQPRRQERVERFQSDNGVRLFLISLRAGGLGLNLTAADYVFLMDPWWNPAVELQAVDRTHRIGQNKQVFTYRFVSSRSVEEKVLSLQDRKRDLVNSILAGAKDIVSHLSRDDLEHLFS